ncbi:MAG: divalent-cation tolerance protein CutA [Actinomycetota bacterium]|nr:divalent-cation tolerance protein CutA [Actinomycetota bacterium]
MSQFLQVMTTLDSDTDANHLAKELVEARLAACVQIVGPIHSTYWWKAEIEKATEWLCIIKTRTELFDVLAERITALHSYETPEITATPITDGSPDYLTWIADETTAQGPARP